MGLLAEERLVLLLCRGHLRGREESTARRLLAGPLRWEGIAGMVEAEAVYPLVRRNLLNLGLAGVPSDMYASLDGQYKANALRNVLMATELKAVLAVLANAGVPAIPLKGVRLSEFLYGDPSLRVCSDMDVLVPVRNVGEAVRLFRRQRYASEFTEQDFFEDLLLSHDIEYQLFKPSPIFDHSLELHWALLSGARWEAFAIEDLWRSAKQTSESGVEFYRLTNEWEFLYLCVHAARHRWRGLKWLVDIHELSHSSELDWARVQAKAKAFGWLPLVEVTFAVCHSLFETPVPPPFPSRSPPAWVNLFPSRPTWPTALTDALAFARLLDRPSRKLSYLLGVIFVPTLAERRVIRLPSPLAGLYYVIRPLRLAARWGGRFLRIVLGRSRRVGLMGNMRTYR